MSESERDKIFSSTFVVTGAGAEVPKKSVDGAVAGVLKGSLFEVAGAGVLVPKKSVLDPAGAGAGVLKKSLLDDAVDAAGAGVLKKSLLDDAAGAANGSLADAGAANGSLAGAANGSLAGAAVEPKKSVVDEAGAGVPKSKSAIVAGERKYNNHYVVSLSTPNRKFQTLSSLRNMASRTEPKYTKSKMSNLKNGKPVVSLEHASPTAHFF